MLSTFTGARMQRAISGARRPDNTYDAEAGQSLVRIILAVLVSLYCLIGSVTDLIDSESARIFQLYIPFLMLASGLLFAAIRIWPGVNHSRRILAMLLDFVSLTVIMAFGGDFAAPMASLLLWVTVGFGMRYGVRYLVAATIAALISITVTGIVSPFWHEQPYVLATIVLTILLVPLYANILMADTRAAYRSVEAANLAKSRFLAQASHDLRQPIHAIGLFTSCLREARLAPTERQMVENIEQSLQTVQQMFRSLLDIATLDSGGITSDPQPLRLGVLMRGLITQYQPAASRANVDLRLVPTRLVVNTDLALLTVMLQNLVSNAIKYAPGAKVLIGCRRRGRTVALSIIDCGIGIPTRHQPHVFEEYYRAQTQGRDVEGVGLGLAIVRRMADLIGIGVELSSRPGHGTRVTLTGLPMTDLPVREVPTVRLPPQSLLHGLRVLLIEDDAAVLLTTQMLMQRWGCIVHAVERLPDPIPPCDMVIADFDLNAALTGADAVAATRQAWGATLPAIIITAHEEARVRQHLLPDQVILSKPIRAAELRALMLSLRVQAGVAQDVQ